MSHLRPQLQAFVKLGDFIREYCEYANNVRQSSAIQTPLFLKLDEVITLAGHKNGWFTRENILFALETWGKLLTKDQLEEWLSSYSMENKAPKLVALIMAGNIPLVGFHDFMTVLLTGNSVLIKPATHDHVLLPFFSDYLIALEPSLAEHIHYAEGKMENFDAVIATGSNNSARYFEYYFGNVPNIIRKNRTSVAVLTGGEAPEQLEALGQDIFRYYGLGCRNVSKLFVPLGYDFDLFFKAMYGYKDIIDRQKYANNYDYNKAVYLMSEFKILDNGFLILKNDKSYASPIASLFYEEYDGLESLLTCLAEDEEKIQCVVGNLAITGAVPFGKTQSPRLADYADGVDTVQFLLKT